MLQKVISFEGIDGSGKSTYAKRLVDILRNAGYDVFMPRYDEWEKDQKVDVKSLPDDVAFFYHLAGTILEEKKFVQDEFEKHDFTILDRGLDTNIVYSHLFQKLVRDREFYDEINHIFYKFSRVPDLTFWVCTPVEVALQRIHKTRESVEFYETRDYLERLSELFRRASTRLCGALPPYNSFAEWIINTEDRWTTISGTRSYEEADEFMKKEISQKLQIEL